MVIANPNAQTGVALPLSAVEGHRRAARRAWSSDEAYVDFGGETSAPLVSKYPNAGRADLFQVRLPGGGAAGLRLGPEPLIEDLKSSNTDEPLQREPDGARRRAAAVRDWLSARPTAGA